MLLAIGSFCFHKQLYFVEIFALFKHADGIVFTPVGAENSIQCIQFLASVEHNFYQIFTTFTTLLVTCAQLLGILLYILAWIFLFEMLHKHIQNTFSPDKRNRKKRH